MYKVGKPKVNQTFFRCGCVCVFHFFCLNLAINKLNLIFILKLLIAHNYYLSFLEIDEIVANTLGYSLPFLFHHGKAWKLSV